MQKLTYFYLMFHVSDPIEAYEFYHDIFGATKISEEYLPNGDPYIMVNISGCNILIRPGEITAQGVGIAAALNLIPRMNCVPLMKACQGRTTGLCASY